MALLCPPNAMRLLRNTIHNSYNNTCNREETVMTHCILVLVVEQAELLVVAMKESLVDRRMRLTTQRHRLGPNCHTT